jgi:hypothetical protein
MAMQYSKNFSPRSIHDIYTQRQALFERLKSVSVGQYYIEKVIYQGDNIATFNLRYSMHFELKSGKIIDENDVLEKYELNYLTQEGRWVIYRNYDYIE